MSRSDQIFLDLRIFSWRHDGRQRFCWIVVVMRVIISSIRPIKCHWSNIMATVMYIAFSPWEKTCRAAISSMMYSSHLMGRWAVVATPAPLTSCLSIFLIRLLTAWLYVGFPSFQISSHTWRRWGMKWEIAFLCKFYGGRAAPVWQIIFTGLRSVKGLVGQVPIYVNISDLWQPFGGVRGVVGILGVVEEQHQRVHAGGVCGDHFVLNMLNFGWAERLNFLWGDAR